MTGWTICRQIVSGILPIWHAYREIDGVVEIDPMVYGTQDEALARARELNAQEKAPGAAATALSAEQ